MLDMQKTFKIWDSTTCQLGNTMNSNTWKGKLTICLLLILGMLTLLTVTIKKLFSKTSSTIVCSWLPSTIVSGNILFHDIVFYNSLVHFWTSSRCYIFINKFINWIIFFIFIFQELQHVVYGTLAMTMLSKLQNPTLKNT